jgi:hypothetical protein
MQNFMSEKYLKTILFLLSLIYIVLLLGMITIHYQEIASVPNMNIYDAMHHYNWKYWLEKSDNVQTTFSTFLQFIDLDYLHSRGIIPIITNIGFMSLLALLIIRIIQQLFSSVENQNQLIRNILIFSTVITLFSLIQDSSIVWMFNQQLFAAYFFPLLSYFLLIKFSIMKDNRYFYLLLLSAMMSIIATPYALSALVVLLFLGFLFKIAWFEKLLIFALLLLVCFLYYENISNTVMVIHMLNGEMITKLLLYILNYLGSIFVYVSFEPCCATSSVIGGLFVIGTFIYFTYLVLSKKATESLYWVIWAFLFFYILTAFGSLESINDNHVILFKNRYITPSMIAWLLIFILYIHHFSTGKIIQRRVLTLFLTLISVLFFYQIFAYQHFKKDTATLKLAAMALKLGIDDPLAIENITRSTYIMMYIPSKKPNEKMSIFTVNDIKTKVIQNRVALLKEKNPINFTYMVAKNVLVNNKAVLSNSNRILKGGVENLLLTDKTKKIYRVFGWVYNIKEQKVPNRLVVFDENSNLIGYVITGISRKDVEIQYGKDALESGFSGYIRYLKTPIKLMMVDDKTGEVLEVKYSDFIKN